jgi:hypothetical protein
MKGYFAGGLAWLIVPWAMGSAAALSCLALTDNPISVTYPDMVSSQQIAEGMPLLYGMTSLMGKSGASAGVLILFMAATSATSAELIAFSSVMTYDVYRTYIRPQSTGKELMKVTHIFVSFFAICMGALAVLFNYIGITISWILTFIGIALGPAVFGITLTLFWKRMNKWGMIVACPAASITGIVCWVGSCYKFNGGFVNKTTLNTPYAEAVGNFVALFSALIYIVIISFVWPDNYDFETLDEKFVVGDDATQKEAIEMKLASEAERAHLDKAMKIGMIVAWVIFFALIIIMPLPMFGVNYIFSKAFFRGWVIVIFIWTFLAAIYITFYPLYESKDVLIFLIRVAMGKEKHRKNPVMLADVLNANESGELFDGKEVGQESPALSTKE